MWQLALQLMGLLIAYYYGCLKSSQISVAIPPAEGKKRSCEKQELETDPCLKNSSKYVLHHWGQ